VVICELLSLRASLQRASRDDLACHVLEVLAPNIGLRHERHQPAFAAGNPRAAQHWRLSGAVGYVGFDIAVLWVMFAAIGHRLSAGALVVAYIIGYLANLIPIPGGIGVLEGAWRAC
jgi:hypothetical protein